MLRAITVRVLGAVPVLFFVSLAIFALLRLAPGDAAELLVPEDAGPEEVARARARWGLDDPLLTQFGRFLFNLINFDLGQSYRYRADVFDLIWSRLPATIELASFALVLAILVAIPMGILAALNKGRPVDGLVSVVAISGVSAPSFWIGILLVLIFSGSFGLFPSSGRLPFGVDLPETTGLFVLDAIIAGRPGTAALALQHITLPAVTLAFGMMGVIARITRSAVVDAGQEEYVFTAVAKGLTRRAVVRRHLLPNAAIPITTIVGLELGVLISGSIVVEVVFSWPGLGTLLYQAVTVRDIPLTTGIVVVYTTLFIALNVLIDLFYVLIDPRLRSGGTI